MSNAHTIFDTRRAHPDDDAPSVRLSPAPQNCPPALPDHASSFLAESGVATPAEPPANHPK